MIDAQTSVFCEGDRCTHRLVFNDRVSNVVARSDIKARFQWGTHKGRDYCPDCLASVIRGKPRKPRWYGRYESYGNAGQTIFDLIDDSGNLLGSAISNIRFSNSYSVRSAPVEKDGPAKDVMRAIEKHYNLEPCKVFLLRDPVVEEAKAREAKRQEAKAKAK